MAQPSLPKGTRDFGPAQMAKRYFIIDNIRNVFQKYGFQPLETPAMENLETLTGKYGDEGDQLLFRILDSGEKFSQPINSYISIKNQIVSVLAQSFFGAVFAYYNKEIATFEDFEKKIPAIIEEKFGSNLPQKNRDVKHQLLKDVSTISKAIANEIQKNGKPLDIISLMVKSEEFADNYGDQHYGTITRQVVPYEIQAKISEKGLRYDLTVPFARYVVMNRHDIALPFKRYQIQPVWRADRPQKGRYREFYQCDADVVGTDSLICEAEIILMIKEVFNALKISEYSIKVNHRGILSGLAELAGAKENETALFVAIDKLDKIGEEKVKEELRSKGFDDASLATVFEILNFNGTTQQKIDLLTTRFAASDNGKRGVADFSSVLTMLKDYGVNEDHVEFDISLARGLSYYTGCIFEVKINNVAIGSVSGGGRYDNLTQAFGAKEKLSGVGISFGIDRIYDAMEELQLFPKEAQISSQVLVCHLDEASQRYALNVVNQLRSNGIAAEVYPDQAKVKKQLEYANKKMVPFTIVIGSEEMQSGQLALKNMNTGEQFKVTVNDIIGRLKSN